MHKTTDFTRSIFENTTFGAVEWAAVQTLLIALEYRDPATFRHSLSVSELAVRAGQTLGLSHRALEELQIAGLLHDIGKIGLPDEVLQKEGKLSKRERSLITRHPELSASILTPLPKFDGVREIILQHHERFDGTGYPGGRAEDDILIESRVLAIADAFDALCTERPYRCPLTPEEAIGWIESEVDRQFCPVSVQAFLHVIETQLVNGQLPSSGHSVGVDSFARNAHHGEKVKLKITIS